MATPKTSNASGPGKPGVSREYRNAATSRYATTPQMLVDQRPGTALGERRPRLSALDCVGNGTLDRAPRLGSLRREPAADVGEAPPEPSLDVVEVRLEGLVEQRRRGTDQEQHQQRQADRADDIGGGERHAQRSRHAPGRWSDGGGGGADRFIRGIGRDRTLGHLGHEQPTRRGIERDATGALRRGDGAVVREAVRHRRVGAHRDVRRCPS